MRYPEKMVRLDGVDGNYLVTDKGRIFSIHRLKFLKPYPDKNGYFVVGLRVNKKHTTLKIHRLVAKAFCKGYKEGLEVNHIDVNHQNNRASNLEWVPKFRNRRQSKGTPHLDDKVRNQIGSLYKKGMTKTEIARKFDITLSYVRRTIKRIENPTENSIRLKRIKDTIRLLNNKGVSREKIADHLGVSTQLVYAHMNNMGLIYNKKKYKKTIKK